MVKKILFYFRSPIDIVLSFLVVPAAVLLLGYRRVGSRKLPRTTKRLKRLGVFPIRRHYYEPLFDNTNLKRSLSENRSLPGLDLNVAGQLKWLEKFVYTDELVALKFTDKPNHKNGFFFRNGAFEAGDVEFLYQFIRAIKPHKVIEVGSGSSTKIARMALEKNACERHERPIHICVEPYEQPWLEELEGLKLKRTLIEECDFDWPNELKAGDLLFVDSSHMIRPQGDVLKLYLEVFPKLSSGVYIHIHDIFTPKDYLGEWVINDVMFWNEQYLLEALLSNTDRYEVIGAVNYLRHQHFDGLKKICPYLHDGSEPGSFYLRIR